MGSHNFSNIPLAAERLNNDAGLVSSVVVIRKAFKTTIVINYCLIE